MEKTILDTDIFSEVLKKKHLHVVKTAKQYFEEFGCYLNPAIEYFD